MSLCTCPHITAGDEPTARTNNDRRYLGIGDVRSIRESVFTPCFEILSHPATNVPTWLLNLSDTSFQSIKSKKRRATRKTRPCIIMKQGKLRENNKTDAHICLLATFEKTPMDKLPLLFRHFCVPIAPHDEIPKPNAERHLHSLPYEWGRCNAWMIAWAMKSTRPLGEPWVDKNLPQVRRWFFGKRASAIATRECRKRWLEWTEVCKDSNRAFNITAEFWVRASSIFADSPC